MYSFPENAIIVLNATGNIKSPKPKKNPWPKLLESSNLPIIATDKSATHPNHRYK